MKRLHAMIEGYVQGVGFRAFVVHEALSLGVTGWVRNCWDDRVEVCAEGEQAALERLLSALKRGPISAHVREVQVEWQDATGEFSGFWMRSSL